MNVTVDYLFSVWHQLCKHYCTDEEMIGILWKEIKENYSATVRHYHNLNHLHYMLRELHPHLDKLGDPDTVLFAVFYHDMIYNVRKSDNEEQSAACAADRLRQLHVPGEQIEQCRHHILATRSHEETPDRNTLFVTDADIAILGAPPAEYQLYKSNIRKEYAIYPDFLYKPGRKKVLRHFLAMQNIYHTREFSEKYESQARENIKTELQEL